MIVGYNPTRETTALWKCQNYCDACEILFRPGHTLPFRFVGFAFWLRPHEKFDSNQLASVGFSCISVYIFKFISKSQNTEQIHNESPFSIFDSFAKG